MAIATECPNCHKTYNVRDEQAGKRVTCIGCHKPFVITPSSVAPAPAAPKPVPTPTSAKPAAPKPVTKPVDADALAIAALKDEPPVKVAHQPAADVAGAPIIVKCPHCDHQNRFEPRMAGKNAPCQNEECRKIIKVPLPVKEEAKDWRTVKAVPSLAKVEAEKLEGAWGNVQTTAVSRDALKEADAAAPEVAEPWSWPKRISYAMASLAVVGLLAVGGRWMWKRHSVGQQTDTMKLALKDADKLKPEQAGLVNILAARLDAHNGKAKEALNRLKAARGQFAGATPAEQQLVQIEIADCMVELIGTPEEVKAGSRLDWEKDKLHGELNNCIRSLKGAAGEDGQEMRAHAFRVLTRRFVERGRPDLLVAVAGLIPEEMGELLAASGLEMLSLGQRAEAEKLAETASRGGVGGPSLIALWLAVGSPDAPAEKTKRAQAEVQKIAPLPKTTPPPVARIGYAEGFARQGKIEEGRSLAWGNGKPDERLRAGVAVASAVIAAKPDDHKDLQACAEMLDKDLKNQKVSGWLLYRLVGLSLKAGRPDLADRFAAAIGDAGLKAWGQYDALRARLRSSGQPADPEIAKSVGSPDRLAHLLAWAAVARQKAVTAGSSAAEKEVRNWDNDLSKRFGHAGIALADVPD
ncbi:MAG: hypothetical protein ACJ8F7_21450 [Gemmataceae bacterium]